MRFWLNRTAVPETISLNHLRYYPAETLRGGGGLCDGGGPRVGVARGRRGPSAQRAGAADGRSLPPTAARRAAGTRAQRGYALHCAHARRRLVCDTSPTHRILF